MKASELRIGNWIHSPSKDPLMPIKGDFQVEAWHLGAMVSFEHTAERWINYQPIPLTEEWLFKFGFEKPGVHYLKLVIGDIREDLQSSLQVAFPGCGYVQVCRAGINAYSAKVEYVHQLQNLYFCLTGKELELTPSTV